MNRATAAQATPEIEIEEVAEPTEHLTLQPSKHETLGAARGILRGVCAGAIVWAVALTIFLVLA